MTSCHLRPVLGEIGKKRCITFCHWLVECPLWTLGDTAQDRRTELREGKVLKNGLLWLRSHQRVYAICLFLKEKQRKDIKFTCDVVILWAFKWDIISLQSRLDVYLAQSPAGTSVQNMLHWGQVCVSCFWYKTHTSLQEPQGALPENSLQVSAGSCHCPVDVPRIRISSCWFSLLSSSLPIFSVWSLGLVPRHIPLILILKLLCFS